MTAPVVESLAMSASSGPPLKNDWTPLTAVTPSPALPEIAAPPVASTAIALAASSPLAPPIKVRYEIAEPAVLSLATKASLVVVEIRLDVEPGKLVERVLPAT